LLRTGAPRDLGGTRRCRHAVRGDALGRQLPANLEPADRLDLELGVQRLGQILAERVDARGVEVDRDTRDDGDLHRRISER